MAVVQPHPAVTRALTSIIGGIEILQPISAIAKGA